MNTLVATHGGLERVTRGGRTGAELARGWFARWVEAIRRRQQERAFEVLMDLDPRVRAEIDAAMARRSR